MEFVIKQCVDVLNKHCEVNDPNYADLNKNYHLGRDTSWYVSPVEWTDLDLQPNNHRTYCYKQQFIYYYDMDTPYDENNDEPGDLCNTCKNELRVLEIMQNSESYLLDRLIDCVDGVVGRRIWGKPP